MSFSIRIDCGFHVRFVDLISWQCAVECNALINSVIHDHDRALQSLPSNPKLLEIKNGLDERYTGIDRSIPRVFDQISHAILKSSDQA